MGSIMFFFFSFFVKMFRDNAAENDIGNGGVKSRFCHGCGSKYPVESAKFCCECGIKRMFM